MEGVMSLDVSLMVDGREVYSANITHNLGQMARAAGIYMQLWRPSEIGCEYAKDIEDAIALGLADMVARPSHYEQFDAENGWGTYRDFVPWIAKYLEALRKHPNAIIEVSI